MGRCGKAGFVVVAAAALLAGGCASNCSATSEKLAHLRRGMSQHEATAVMGCEGRQVSQGSSAAGELTTVEWDGPTFRLSRNTQLDFRDGRLLSFTTGRRGGF